MPLHRIYGLTLAADRPVPGLPALSQAAPPDVSLCLGQLPDGAAEAASSWPVTYRTTDAPGALVANLVVRTAPAGSGTFFVYADGTRFLVEGEQAVFADWPSSLGTRNAATYLLGPVLGWALRRRRALCLHAGVTTIDGRAIGFLGDCGSGKSTTVAAFAAAGCAALSDDMLVMSAAEPLVVQPGYPRLRLWAGDATHALTGGADLPRLAPEVEEWDKRYLALDGAGRSFDACPRPLGALYVLGDRRSRDAPAIEPIDRRQALLLLVANGYVNYLLDTAMQARQLAAVAALVERVPVKRLVAHEDPARLPELVERVRADVAALQGTA